jgi:hypothetical protein
MGSHPQGSALELHEAGAMNERRWSITALDNGEQTAWLTLVDVKKDAELPDRTVWTITNMHGELITHGYKAR